MPQRARYAPRRPTAVLMPRTDKLRIDRFFGHRRFAVIAEEDRQHVLPLPGPLQRGSARRVRRPHVKVQAAYNRWLNILDLRIDLAPLRGSSMGICTAVKGRIRKKERPIATEPSIQADRFRRDQNR